MKYCQVIAKLSLISNVKFMRNISCNKRLEIHLNSHFLKAKLHSNGGLFRATFCKINYFLKKAFSVSQNSSFFYYINSQFLLLK